MNKGKFTIYIEGVCTVRGAALVAERAQLLQVAAAGPACGPAGSAGGSHNIGDCRGFVGGWEGIIFYMSQAAISDQQSLFKNFQNFHGIGSAACGCHKCQRSFGATHGSWDQVIKGAMPGRGGVTVTLAKDCCLPVAL